jgi:hypothetical protein
MPRPRVKPGDPITAEALNSLLDLADRAGIDLAVGSGLDRRGGAIVSTRRWEGFVKLTSRSGSSYAWTEAVRVGGAWEDGVRSGTTTDDPALEVNAATSLSTFPTRVRAWRLTDGTLAFQVSACP